MTFRVGSAQLWPSRFAVGQPQWPGLGVPFDDIPTSGANGGSPVADDGIAAGHEYRIETIETPSAGTLTIYPDLTASFVGAPDGSYTWRYTLYEDGVSQGIGIVTFAVGAVNVNLAAAGVTVSTGSGGLSVAVAASAVGVSVADGAAGLAATVTISAAGLAEAAGAAGLTVSSGGELLANGVALASGTAALDVAITLQATGSAESGGSAALVGGAAEVTLTAAGYAQAMAAGALTVDVDMTAAGAVVAGGTALATVSGGSSSGGSAAIDFALDDDLFYSDFAVEVNYLPASGPAAVGLAILDQPGITVLGGDVMATDFALRFPRGRFGPVRRGDRFVVAGTVYSAREAARPVDVSGLDEFVPLARA